MISAKISGGMTFAGQAGMLGIVSVADGITSVKSCNEDINAPDWDSGGDAELGDGDDMEYVVFVSPEPGTDSIVAGDRNLAYLVRTPSSWMVATIVAVPFVHYALKCTKDQGVSLMIYDKQ